MSGVETIVVTATTIAVRALIDGIAALREGAKADERAEIERLLAGLHASAPQPVASSLDGIRDAHLARVRADVAEVLLADGGMPRRSRLDLLDPAESAIVRAVDAVEAMGADPRLTDAVVALGKARDHVADVVDEKLK